VAVPVGVAAEVGSVVVVPAAPRRHVVDAPHTHCRG
jgi:hypothetical protein